jgi:hypothetical protein
VTEIAECWGASIPDLACYTLDGLLQIAIMTIAIRVETGTFTSTDRGLVRIPHCETALHGPQPVISSDLWAVFRTGAGRIARFKPQTPDGYIDLAEGVDPLAITVQDLLVTRAERERFEEEHGLADKPPPHATADPSAAPEFLHRDDYAEVVLNGEIFRLGALQAAVVRALHAASQTENPWRPGKELLTNCNAQTLRMVDLFKTKPNWRTLIASDVRHRWYQGAYWCHRRLAPGPPMEACSGGGVWGVFFHVVKS